MASHHGGVQIAAVQFTATPDKDHNRGRVSRLVRMAAGEGSDVVVLPELWNCCGPAEVLRAGAEPLDGPSLGLVAELARDLGVWIVAGTIVERTTPGSGPPTANTCVVVDPAGDQVAHYRKLHLFDVDVPGAGFRESETVSAGERVVVADVAGVRVGLSVCYDVRFPELFRLLVLDGAEVVVVPAAFTAQTGPAHWEVLLRARAIEDQCFVVAADQCGRSTDRLAWHGHSMVIDPWGTVLAEAGGTEAVVPVVLDLDEVRRVRSVLPSLANRRPALYRGLDDRPG